MHTTVYQKDQLANYRRREKRSFHTGNSINIRDSHYYRLKTFLQARSLQGHPFFLSHAVSHAALEFDHSLFGSHWRW